MNKSESITKIAPALLAAQKKIGSAVKGAVNPFFKSKYADLGSVMEACKDILNENGIIVLQPIGSDETGVYVETVLLHESGEFLSDRMRIAVKAPNDPQAQGSAITYARRYSLQSMVFIPAEDDDAEKATNHKPVEKVDYGEPDDMPPLRAVVENQKWLETPTEIKAHFCTAHNTEMEKKHSAAKNKDYWCHRNNEGLLCFGSGYLPKLSSDTKVSGA